MCESMIVRGAASLRAPASAAAAPLASGQRIPNGSVVELADGADLTIRTADYREVTIAGPAKATLCPDGEDTVLLSRGKVSAYPGTGVRPGVDVWVATPLGVVRYADAKIDIDAASADGTRLAVSASMARADLLPAPATQLLRADAGAESTNPFVEVPIAAGATLTLERPAASLARLVPQLVRACAKESETAAEAARELAAGTDAGQLGMLAMAHVRAKRRARAACETARAAAGLIPGALDGSLSAELTAADEKRNQLTPLPARR
jgi:hypothetical protein